MTALYNQSQQNLRDTRKTPLFSIKGLSLLAVLSMRKVYRNGNVFLEKPEKLSLLQEW